VFKNLKLKLQEPKNEMKSEVRTKALFSQ